MVPDRSGAIFVVIFGKGLPIGSSESPDSVWRPADTVGM
jgi:hypothetical protein